MQYQTKLSNIDSLQDLYDSAEERLRQFGEGEGRFPEGSPIISQNFLESNSQWRAINPHPPIVPDDSEENISSGHSGRMNIIHHIFGELVVAGISELRI